MKARPPSFAVFLRGRGDFTDVDARTVTNSLREDFGFDGVPLRVLLRRQHWAEHVERRQGRGVPSGQGTRQKVAQDGHARRAQPRAAAKPRGSAAALHEYGARTAPHSDAAESTAASTASAAARRAPAATSARLLAHAGKGGADKRPKPRRRAYRRPRKSTLVHAPL